MGLFWAISTGAQATPSVDIEAANRQAERLQQELDQRIRQQRLKDLSSEQPPVRFEVNPPASASRSEGVCRTINQVELQRVTLLSQRQMKALKRPYEGNCLGVADIERLMADITATYMRRGYVAARAYLPAQDLSQGTLTLIVEEGRLEAIDVDDGGAGSINPWIVMPASLGQPLNLRDLEQALDQINRLASNNASMVIVPGKEPGTSRVRFSNQPRRPYRLNLTYDNGGQVATGREQLGINLAFDNLLGLNDFFSVTHRRAYPYEQGVQASYFNSVSYVQPLGYTTFSLNLSESAYASVLQTASGNTLHTRGDSQTYTAQLDRVLWRGQSAQWNASAALTQKEAGNYLEDSFLAVSSRRLTVYDIDTQFTTHLLGGAFSASVGIARGLALFNSLKDPANLPAWAPRAQFEKYKYSLSWWRPFDWLQQSMSFNSQFSGQYAADVLYGSERQSIGSPYTVRGFNEQSISGDHGYFWRNELALNYPLALPGGYPALLRPFIAVDYGKAWNREEPPVGHLTSASLGLSVNTGPVGLALTWSQPLEVPQDTIRPADSLAFTVNLSL